MAQERINQQSESPAEQSNETVDTPQINTQGQDAGVDSILDEIDGLLETNASEFVSGYVQKGGQ